MENYLTLNEKLKYFKIKELKIDNDEKFDYYSKLLFLQNENKEFIFRGLPEAKYKLYTTAQREWESQKSVFNDYSFFIDNLINNCKKWNNNSIINLFKSYKISEYNSIAYLAFMQQHGIPTPFIDFTKNLYIALYFATENINYDEKYSNDIDSYFSIYSTYQNNTAFEIFNDTFQKSRIKENYGKFDFNNYSKNRIFLVTDKCKEFKIINSNRIVNQEGIFFFNNHQSEPIESVYKDFSNELEKIIDKNELEKIYIHDSFASCFNIHKKYARKIKEVLKKKGIDKEFIYPDISKLKDFIAMNNAN